MKLAGSWHYDGLRKQAGGSAGKLRAFYHGKKADPGKILEELKRYDGKVLQASLTHENEAMLTSAIETDRHNTSTRR